VRAATRAYACFGALLIAVHLAVGGSLGIYEAIGLMSAGAIIIAIGIHRPANWAGWAGIGFAQLLFASGDLVYYHVPGGSRFPGPSDVLYLTSYAVFIPSLFLLMGTRFPWRDWGGHIDAILITTALAVATWMIFLDESFSPTWSSGSVVSLAYPIADVACIGVMIRIGLAPGRRNLSYWLVLVSLLPLLVADGSYVLPAISNTFAAGHWLDAGWLGSYVLLGSAALHPSMVDIASPNRERVPVPMRRVLLAGASLVCLPLAATWETLTKHQHDFELLAAGGLVILVGIVARAVVLVQELERQRRRAARSERLFRMIFERSPVGISVGRDGILSRTNPALQSMLGYTGEELSRMHHLEITHPDDQELSVQAELDAGGRDAFSIDKRLVGRDGRVVNAYVHVTLDPEEGQGIALIEDATRRVQLEEQLRQSQKMEAIGQLAGGVAHDFNNLMTAVLGYSDLVLKRLSPGDVNREKVEAIRDSAMRAADLTRQLLAFGRRQMLQATDVDLRDVVDRMDSLLRRLIGDHVELVAEFGAEPVVVRADPTQLEQVVMNLVVNARDAMPDGGRVTITAGRDDGAALLSVADTGCGMDEATLERAFEPFFTTKPLGAGTGLGLSTVHGIVGQSGGAIDVRSAPGRGTTFTIRLPLAPASRPLPEREGAATLLTD
jgi:PAS domain S-box-containing protein